MAQSNTALLQLQNTITQMLHTNGTLHNPHEYVFIAIKQESLHELQKRINSGTDPQLRISLITELTRQAAYIAQLNRDGYLTIKDRFGAKETGTYIDLAIKIAECIGADINDPTCQGLICTCPTECDCANYEAGLVSNECPIHNENPQPAIDCPQHGS